MNGEEKDGEVEEEDIDSQKVDQSWDGNTLGGDESDESRSSQFSNLSPNNLDEDRFAGYEGEGFGSPQEEEEDHSEEGNGGADIMGDDSGSQFSAPNLEAFQQSFAGAGGTYEERKVILCQMMANLHAAQAASTIGANRRGGPEGTPTDEMQGVSGNASTIDEMTAGQSAHIPNSSNRSPPEEQDGHEKPPTGAGGEVHPPGEGDDASDPG